MKITLELKALKAESAYLGLRKALPDLKPEELEAGIKETGIAPLCRGNLDERLFHKGLEIVITELTNPGATIASAIAKASDLTLISEFRRTIYQAVIAMAKRKAELTEKLGEKKALKVRVAVKEFIAKLGTDAWAWTAMDYQLVGLEQALTIVGQVLSADHSTTAPGTPAKEKKNVRSKRVPLPRRR